MEQEKRIALLIDADNTQIGKIESVIMEISKNGKVLVKRAYGNWSKDTLKNWEDTFRELAIKPIQQIDYVKGKNATDMALTIDAMDFLYNSDYDSFAIVSSDSDFTPLAIKLRESNKEVIGIGEKKTSEAFVASCDSFIYLENLSDKTQKKAKFRFHFGKHADSENLGAADTADTKEEKETTTDLDDLLRIAYETWQDDDDFVDVSIAGQYIKRIRPDFDIRMYGASKLTEYIKKNPKLYEIKNHRIGNKRIYEYRVKD